MDLNTKNLFITLLDTNKDKFLKELSNCIKTAENDNVDELLAIMEENRRKWNCLKSYREGEDRSETLLHIAVKYGTESKRIKRIVHICPDLLSLSRENSEKYKGQTPLHIAITRGDETSAKLLLSLSAKHIDMPFSNRTKLSMINTQATGRMFVNTVMMGELPLTVAALTFNKDIVNILLEHGADMHAQNSFGDTVLHSLVKYSAVYPDKTEKVIHMFQYFIERTKQNPTDNYSQLQANDSDIFLEEDSYIWFLENNDTLTPLQLSAKLGVVEIFQFIIKLENVYSFVSTHDGLFDVKMYDISEIDTVANQQVSTVTMGNESYGNKKVSRNIDGVSRTSVKTSTDCISVKCTHFDYPETESILEMMFDFDYNSTSAFRIIETIPVKNIIQKKWRTLRYFYFIWGVYHMLLIACMTAEIVIRSDMYSAETIVANVNYSLVQYAVSNDSKKFANGISWISFVSGVIYFVVLALILIAKVRRPHAIRYCFHNIGYIFFLAVFSICLICDFIQTQSSIVHDNVALILAVIAGWWFAIFFLRAIRLFSFFTEMIRRVIIGDLLRFSVIISFMLFAFSAGMYAVFIGKLDLTLQQSTTYADAIDQNFSSFGQTILTMFKLMFGLGGIEILSEARMPGLAIALYVVFVLLTYVLLINSLIAMMSQTCAIVLEDRYPQWRLQQLSVILFLEDLICLPIVKHICKSPGEKREIRGFDPVTKQTRSFSRYFFKIHSLQTTYASEEDREAMKKTLKEPERRLNEETLLSDQGCMNNCLPIITTRKSSYLSSIKRRNTQRLRLPDIESPTAQFYNIDDRQTRLNRKKSAKRHSNCVEKETVFKKAAVYSGSEPDLIKTRKSSEGSRRRYHAENMHEKENSISSQMSMSNEHVSQDGRFTPVDHRIHVHNHSSDCPENRERFIPNGHSQHVDIEPYPYLNA